MVSDAEKYKEDDEKIKKQIEARNQLESYVYNMSSTLSDEKIKDKIDETDRETLDEMVKNTQSWLDSHMNEEASSYEDKLKECEAIANPIMSKMYQGRWWNATWNAWRNAWRNGWRNA